MLEETGGTLGVFGIAGTLGALGMAPGGAKRVGGNQRGRSGRGLVCCVLPGALLGYITPTPTHPPTHTHTHTHTQ